MRNDSDNSTNSDSHDDEEMTPIVTRGGPISTTTATEEEDADDERVVQEVKCHNPPHDAPFFSPGAIVYFTGLLELPELNGIQGTVEDYDNKKERYNVTSKILSKTVSVKSCNLCSTIKQAFPIATAFTPGTIVIFIGLVKAPELNGTEGVVEDYDDVKERYNVVSKVFSKTVSVKTCNLVIKNGTDTGSLGTEKGKVAELAFDKVAQGRIPVENISSLLGEVGKKFDGDELEAQVAVMDPSRSGFITRSSFVDWFSRSTQETNRSMIEGEPLVKNGDKGNGPDDAVCVEATETSSNIFTSPLASPKTTLTFGPASDTKAVGAATSGSDVLGLDGKTKSASTPFNMFASPSTTTKPTFTFGPSSGTNVVGKSGSDAGALDGKTKSTSNTPFNMFTPPSMSTKPTFTFGPSSGTKVVGAVSGNDAGALDGKTKSTSTPFNMFTPPSMSTKPTFTFAPSSGTKVVGAVSGSDAGALDGKTKNTSNPSNVFTSTSTFTFGPPSDRKDVGASSSKVVGLDGKTNRTSTPFNVSSIPTTSGFVSFGSTSSNSNSSTTGGFNFSSSSAKPTFSFGSPSGIKVGGDANNIGANTKANESKVPGDKQAEDESTSTTASHFINLDQGLNSHMAQLQDKMVKINLDRESINKRHEILMSRKKKLLQDAGGTRNEVSGADIFKLNVRGKELYARRDTLTVVKGSRLANLFGGFWDDRLLKDDNGYVFMDVDPTLFVKLLEYLYMIKLTINFKESYLMITKGLKEDEERELLDSIFEFFGIHYFKEESAKCSVTQPNKNANTQGDEDFIKRQQEIIIEMKAEVTRQEKDFEAEEYFIHFFTTKKASSKVVNNDTKVRDCNSYEIINLFALGGNMSLKRTTLYALPDNKLTQFFHNDDWLEENAIVTKDGKTFILLELPTDFVVKLIKLLDTFVIGKKDPGPMGNTVSLDGSDAVRDAIIARHLGFKIPVFYSKIIKTVLDENTLVGYLLNSIGKTNIDVANFINYVGEQRHPWARLVYRASRDDWKIPSHPFNHPTLMILKTVGGFVLGGYVHLGQSKTNSNSFIFALHSMSNSKPFKIEHRPIPSTFGSQQSSAFGSQPILVPKYIYGVACDWLHPISGDYKQFSVTVNKDKNHSHQILDPNVPFPFGFTKFTLKEVEVFRIDWQSINSFLT